MAAKIKDDISRDEEIYSLISETENTPKQVAERLGLPYKYVQRVNERMRTRARRLP
jgi:hypothetical protein